MILVLLGTHELPFTRLMREVEKLKIEKAVDDEIIVQNGNTKYESEFLTLKPFVSFEEMENLYNQARLIITHAGTGSVITGIKKGKKVIAVPRLEKYGEHNDDHQLELVEVFEEAGHILSWSGQKDLIDVIKDLDTFEPKPFHSGRDHMLQLIREFIEDI